MRVLLVAALAVLALAGCTTRVGGGPSTPSSPSAASGPVDLVVPIEFRPVLTTGAPATTLPSEGEQLPLAEPIMTVDRLEHAAAKLSDNGGGWILEITLTDKDASTFGDWTTAHTGERLAMVADGEVLMAPTIQSPITGGDLQISANYDRKKAEALLAKITGR